MDYSYMFCDQDLDTRQHIGLEEIINSPA